MGVQRTVFSRGLELATLLVVFSVSSPLATTIGIYSDASGSNCSFSGNNAGLVTTYVVVRPDGDGVRGVRFAAPVPSCFNAVWLSDVVPDGVVSIGDSQTGISLAVANCSVLPESMLQIYFFHNGGSAPCCAFPIVADPGSGTVEVTTCAFGTANATPITSHMNADASCACNDDVAPMPPSDPNPQDGVTGIPEWPSFIWTGQDWDGDLTNFDVYLGTSTNPPLVATVTTASWELAGPLAPLTTYHWRVIAHDAQGHATPGPLWSFTTGRHNNPPSITLLEPENGSFDNAINQALFWNATDPDGNGVVFDIYFGTTNPPPFVGMRSTTFYMPLLAEGTQYYWRVVARDAPHSETSSPIWTFRTGFVNPAPFAPDAPTPDDGALNVALDADLSWNASDPQQEAVHCEVRFGINPNALVIVADNVIPGAGQRATFDPGALAVGQNYYWRIRVIDARGAATTGPTWTFSTGGNLPPNPPTLVAPPDGSTNQPLDVTLSWSGSDPNPSQSLRYDVYVGTDPLPPQVFSFVQGTSVTFHTTLALTKFYWRVVARDPFSQTATGPTWTFTTRQFGTGNPPTVPSNPIPANGGTASTAGVTLQWTSTDPDGTSPAFVLFFGTTNPPPFLTGTGAQASYATGPLTGGQHYYWQVAAGDGTYTVFGPVWSFTADSPLPVLFSRFEAIVDGAVARVRWELESDESMSSYAVLRRLPDTMQFASIATGAVSTTAGEYVDRAVEGGKSYQYQLLIQTASGREFRSQTTTVVMPVLELALGHNHPNPFNPQTTIPYTVPPSESPLRVRVAIYDMHGRLVRVLVDENQGGGAHETRWNGQDRAGSPASSGIYLCVLQAGNQRRTQKMVLLK